jgi:hypothetical protein
MLSPVVLARRLFPWSVRPDGPVMQALWKAPRVGLEPTTLRLTAGPWEVGLRGIPMAGSFNVVLPCGDHDGLVGRRMGRSSLPRSEIMSTDVLLSQRRSRAYNPDPAKKWISASAQTTAAKSRNTAVVSRTLQPTCSQSSKPKAG